MLNYAYAVLEGECRTARLPEGLDTACGFLHSGRRDRDSLVYDMMEPLRATVDNQVLNLLRKGTLVYGDFVRGNDGACRLHPQFARYVVVTCRLIDSHMEEHVRWLQKFFVGRTTVEIKAELEINQAIHYNGHIT